MMVEWLLRCGLALVFVASAAAKLPSAGRSQFASALAALTAVRGVATSRALLVAVVVVELSIASGLVLAEPTGWLVASATALTVFSAVTVSAVARGVQVGCACFGALSSRPIGMPVLLRNWALTGLVFVVLSIEEEPRMFIVAAVFVGLGLLATQTVLIVQLSRRLSSPTTLAGPVSLEPPITGVVVPPVITSSGKTLSANLVLAFLSPGCRSCQRSVQDLSGLVVENRVAAAACVDEFGARPEQIASMASALTAAGIPAATNTPELIRALGVRSYPSFAVAGRDGVVTASCTSTERLFELVSIEQRIGW